MSFDIVQKSFDRNNLIREPWEGTAGKELVFFQMYLQEKYKNDLFTVPLFSVEFYTRKHDTSLVLFSETNTVWLNKVKSNKKISLQGNKTSSENKKTYENIKNKFRTSKKRFISFPLGTKIDEEDGHAYSLLYDKETEELELFQRYSSNNDETKNSRNLKFMLKKFFKDIFGKDVKIVYDEGFCIYSLFYSKRCETQEKYYKDFYEGDCLLWALWYLELRLKNKHFSREKVIKKIKKNYGEVTGLGKDKYSYKACELMIGYRHFIDNFVKQFIIRETESGTIIKISRKRTPLFDKAKRLLKTYLFLMNSFIQRTFIENKKLTSKAIKSKYLAN
jgi:hypothetical protein